MLPRRPNTTAPARQKTVTIALVLGTFRRSSQSTTGSSKYETTAATRATSTATAKPVSASQITRACRSLGGFIKLQIPNPKSQKSSKHQAPKPAVSASDWNAELYWDLELGIWNFPEA